MNREVKFRAWDKKTKTIRNVMSIDFAEGTVMIEPIPSDDMYAFFKVGDTFTGGYVKKMEDVVLEQTIGLQDKNGKEIYEGDVIKSHWIRNTYPQGDISLISVIKFGKYDYGDYETQYQGLGFYGEIVKVCHKDFEDYIGEQRDIFSLEMDNTLGIEVIGNIHVELK